jgi:hypothetical protein
MVSKFIFKILLHEICISNILLLFLLIYEGLLTWLSTILRSSPRYCSISECNKVSIPDTSNTELASIFVLDKDSNRSESMKDIYVTSIISEFIIQATSVIGILHLLL